MAFYLPSTGLNTSADPVVQSRLNIQSDFVPKPLNHGMSSKGGLQQRLVNRLVKLVQRAFTLSSHSSNVAFIGHCRTLMRVLLGVHPPLCNVERWQQRGYIFGLDTSTYTPVPLSFSDQLRHGTKERLSRSRERESKNYRGCGTDPCRIMDDLLEIHPTCIILPNLVVLGHAVCTSVIK